jgi:soluble lytic murein transglycosylase-like protein
MGLAGQSGIILGADPARKPDVRQAMEQAAAAQRQSVMLMQASLEKQRQSLPRQAPRQQAGSFFLLPPPAAAEASVYPPGPIDCDPVPLPQLERLIAGAAQREGLQPDLLRGIMKQESGFRPCAVSPKGAIGLMQIMPATAAQFNLEDPFDPEENVNVGARLLKELLGRYNGNLAFALGAYNAGPSRVDEAGGVPNIPETTNYVERILSSLPQIPSRDKSETRSVLPTWLVWTPPPPIALRGDATSFRALPRL